MDLKKFWYETKTNVEKQGRIFSERLFLDAVRKEMSTKELDKVKSRLDRRVAELPHHFRPDWNPVTGRAEIVKWRAEFNAWLRERTQALLALPQA